MKSRCARWWLSCVAVLFVTSTGLPAFTDAEWGPVAGYRCLIEFPFAMMIPAWWANLTLCIGVGAVIAGTRLEPILFGAISLSLAATFPFSLNETDQLLPGFWVWLTAHLLFLAGSVAAFRSSSTLHADAPTGRQATN